MYASESLQQALPESPEFISNECRAGVQESRIAVSLPSYRDFRFAEILDTSIF